GQQPGRVGSEGPGRQVGQDGARFEVTDGEVADGVAAVVCVQPDVSDGRGVGQAVARCEVTDGECADGVAAVVGVQPDGGAGTVGDEGVIAPRGEQLLLVAEVADAAHDEPVAAIRGLGDLREPVAGVADVDPVGFGDGGDGA